MQSEEPKNQKLTRSIVDKALGQIGAEPERKRGGRNYLVYDCPCCHEADYQIKRHSLYFYPDENYFRCRYMVDGRPTYHEKEVHEKVEKWLAENE